MLADPTEDHKIVSVKEHDGKICFITSSAKGHHFKGHKQNEPIGGELVCLFAFPLLDSYSIYYTYTKSLPTCLCPSDTKMLDRSLKEC